MNLAAHRENAYQAVIDVTMNRIVPIIAMKTDVTMEAMAIMEVIQISMWCEGRIESFA